jgi:single-strand DNA-binding protein
MDILKENTTFIGTLKHCNMIKLQVIGNLGKDAVTNTVNGKTVINFSVAHTEKFKDNTGNQKERTIWVECAYWTDRTAIAPYLKKGSQVYVEGNPDIRSYTTQDGKQGASLTLRIQNVQLLGNRNNEGGENGGSYQNSYQNGNSYQQAAPQHNAPAAIANEPMDDLPF